jgi:A/G-specific adenine glycosylase
MDNRYFSDKVVKWYLQNMRDLPWRQTRDPYRIWLSEILLQQTRVSQGLPYYLRFVETFPDVRLLAAASEQEILRLWQGLGYYTRARNLHKCAREVVSSFDGKFPATFEDLKKLPGIGDYTAAAIASICFREPVAVVDGNVFRVLSRIFGIDHAINSPEGKKHFSSLANTLVTQNDPDVYNQAVMEFGALHCTPQKPQCDNCPFYTTCFAAQKGLQHKLPVKLKGKAVRKRYFNYFVIKKGNSLLMKKREQKDIWHGLYDFYLIETKRSVKIARLVSDDPWLKKLKAKPAAETNRRYKHILSHQVIISSFTIVENGNRSMQTEKNLKFFTPTKIADLPKPVLISRFLKDHQLL